MNPRKVVNRREFLKTAGTVGATIALGKIPQPLLNAAEPSTAALPTPSWVEKPTRWAQLTLVEDDPGKFDLQFWLDYFKRTRSDAVCLSAGGCVAYYPTQVPFHHRSAWLGDRDVFGELVAGCRKLGMVVIARTDPHATYDDVQAAHPDWIAVDAAGKPRRHWASPEMWVTCGLGPYNFEFMTEVKREIMSRYRVDAIFINRWDGSGMCYCEHCRNNFRGATGHELPRTTDAQDPARRAYILDRRFARDNLPDHGDLLANLIRWAAKDDIPLAVEGPGLVDCHLYRQPGRLILHLVNLTSAGTWRQPVHELIPIGPLRSSPCGIGTLEVMGSP